MKLLLGVHANSRRDRQVRLECFPCLVHTTTKGFAVKPQSRCRALDPMHHHQCDDIRVTQCLMYISPVVELLHKPCQKADGRITQRKSQRLWPRPLLLQVATLILLKVLAHSQ